jgi:hypothetical protein
MEYSLWYGALFPSVTLDQIFGRIFRILYRGRHYHPKKRPVIPLMLWKPAEPIYPRQIKITIEGLTVEETKEIRKKGPHVPVLTKLCNPCSTLPKICLAIAKEPCHFTSNNGYYASLVLMVRDALLADELVRIDCKGLPKGDYRKIGVKLRVCLSYSLSYQNYRFLFCPK